MRKLYYALTLAALPLVAACEKSVNQAEHDLERTRQNAAQNIKNEQRDVTDAARNADDKITKEQRDVADTAKAEARRTDPNR